MSTITNNSGDKDYLWTVVAFFIVLAFAVGAYNDYRHQHVPLQNGATTPLQSIMAPPG